MRQKRTPIPLSDAYAIIQRHSCDIARTECVSLAEAGGRVLGEDVVATVDVPPFSRAAMDGYALRAADTVRASASAPTLLRCVEEVFAGHTPRQSIASGQCAAIATGGPMPAGADAVVMVEKSRRDADRVQIMESARSGQHVGREAADIQTGQHVARAGDALTPGRIGAIAAVGCGRVNVYAQPRVAILSTGDEIVDPGRPLGPSQIYDVNKYTLATMIAGHGCLPQLQPRASDTRDDLFRAIDESLNCDVLVFSGGSSVGARDFILDVVALRGEVMFASIAVKPGKPTGFGLIDGRPVFVMPGYPAACLINAHVLMRPALRRIARLPDLAERPVVVPLERSVPSAPGRHYFCTVRIEDGVAVPTVKKAGDITSVSEAHGYIEIAADAGGVERGTLVSVMPF